MTSPAVIADSPTAVALYAAILADPRCDTARGVFADWLEENGHADRAEFVRVQIELAALDCHHGANEEGMPWCGVCVRRRWLRHRERELWHEDGRKWFLDSSRMAHAIDGEANAGSSFVGIVRRGFVDEVRCTLAGWVGGPCVTCGGEGDVPASDRLRDRTGSYTIACHGRTPAHGPRIVTEHPVQRAVVTDTESCINEYSTEIMPPNVHFGVSVPVLSEPSWPWPEELFASREEAVDYLHDLPERLVNWARREAGLPVLEDTR